MSSETKWCQNSQWGHVVDVLKRFGALRKPPEAMLDAPGRSRTGYPRATEVLESWKWLWKKWTKAPFIGVSNGKHFWRMYCTKTLLLLFPRRKNSCYLQKNSWCLLKNQHLKVIYCNMHTNVISCRCLNAPWSVWKRFDALLEAQNESKPIPEDAKVKVLCDT